MSGKKFAPFEHVVGPFPGIGVVTHDGQKTLRHEVAVFWGTDHIEDVSVDRLRLASDAEMLELARKTPSESGFGWTVDMAYPYFPGMPCIHCGRFVGRRNAVFNVEHFEMSSTIASLDAEHSDCSARASERWQRVTATNQRERPE